jgi:cytochrome b
MQTSASIQAASAGRAPTPATGRRTIDAPTRMFHWLFALCFLGAYVTADGESWRALHVTLGYTMVGLLAARLLYGLFGPRQAGLGVLWRKLAGWPAWLKSLRSAANWQAVNWRQGQNLLMAGAVVALLVTVVPLTLSGYATYDSWGGEWLEEVHEFFGQTFLTLVLAHLALILGLSLLRRKNQALPMLTGRVAESGPDLVKNNRPLLAAALLCAVLGFAAWQSQQFPNGLWPAGGDAAPESGHRADREHSRDQGKALKQSARKAPV